MYISIHFNILKNLQQAKCSGAKASNPLNMVGNSYDGIELKVYLPLALALFFVPQVLCESEWKVHLRPRISFDETYRQVLSSRGCCDMRVIKVVMNANISLFMVASEMLHELTASALTAANSERRVISHVFEVKDSHIGEMHGSSR